jgi:hypothetical protein
MLDFLEQASILASALPRVTRRRFCETALVIKLFSELHLFLCHPPRLGKTIFHKVHNDVNPAAC